VVLIAFGELLRNGKLPSLTFAYHTGLEGPRPFLQLNFKYLKQMIAGLLHQFPIVEEFNHPLDRVA